jgi:hypothetical protein
VPHRRFPVAAALLIAGTLVSQCSPPKPPAPADPALLGEVKPVVSVKELMQNEIDPLADNIFDAVASEITPKGEVQHAPKTDEDWEKVRIGAVVLAEAANLLKIPRPFAPPGDVSEKNGKDAPELPPEQIKARVDANKPLWNSHAEQLRSVGLEVMEIVKRKDVDALLEAGGKLDEACESCHLEYWYPNERKFHDERERKFYEEQKQQQKKP